MPAGSGVTRRRKRRAEAECEAVSPVWKRLACASPEGEQVNSQADLVRTNCNSETSRGLQGTRTGGSLPDMLTRSEEDATGKKGGTKRNTGASFLLSRGNASVAKRPRRGQKDLALLEAVLGGLPEQSVTDESVGIDEYVPSPEASSVTTSSSWFAPSITESDTERKSTKAKRKRGRAKGKANSKMKEEEKNTDRGDPETLDGEVPKRGPGRPRHGTQGLKQSQYRGVSWDKCIGSWRCKVSYTHVGYFDIEEEAASAYDEAAISLFNNINPAKLNFPIEEYLGKTKLSVFTSKRETPVRNTLSSLFRGVSWDKVKQRWRAKIKVAGKTQYLGTFESELEAARRYDKKAIEIHGINATVNFPRNGIGKAKKREVITSQRFTENLAILESSASKEAQGSKRLARPRKRAALKKTTGTASAEIAEECKRSAHQVLELPHIESMPEETLTQGWSPSFSRDSEGSAILEDIQPSSEKENDKDSVFDDVQLSLVEEEEDSTKLRFHGAFPAQLDQDMGEGSDFEDAMKGNHDGLSSKSKASEFLSGRFFISSSEEKKEDDAASLAEDFSLAVETKRGLESCSVHQEEGGLLSVCEDANGSLSKEEAELLGKNLGVPQDAEENKKDRRAESDGSIGKKSARQQKKRLELEHQVMVPDQMMFSEMESESDKNDRTMQKCPDRPESDRLQPSKQSREKISSLHESSDKEHEKQDTSEVAETMEILVLDGKLSSAAELVDMTELQGETREVAEVKGNSDPDEYIVENPMDEEIESEHGKKSSTAEEIDMNETQKSTIEVDETMENPVLDGKQSFAAEGVDMNEPQQDTNVMAEITENLGPEKDKLENPRDKEMESRQEIMANSPSVEDEDNKAQSPSAGDKRMDPHSVSQPLTRLKQTRCGGKEADDPAYTQQADSSSSTPTCQSSTKDSIPPDDHNNMNGLEDMNKANHETQHPEDNDTLSPTNKTDNHGTPPTSSPVDNLSYALREVLRQELAAVLSEHRTRDALRSILREEIVSVLKEAKV